MKGTFFARSLEWNIETDRESYAQGESVKGVLRLKNHGTGPADLSDSGVGIAFADIKKVHTRVAGALKFDGKENFQDQEILPNQTIELPFSLDLDHNCPVSDKKSSYYLAYGKDHTETHLQLNVGPKALFGKVIGLMDTFQRFKLKEYKTSKSGVEYKLIPPSSRDMANIESLSLTFSMDGENLKMNYLFQVKKLDHSSVTTKVTKAEVKTERSLTPKEFSLGKDMINQDQLLKSIEGVLGEVKLKSVF